MRKIATMLIGLVIVINLFTSCDEQIVSDDKAILTVNLIDTPASYDAVYVEVLGVEIRYDQQDSLVIELDSVLPTIYNLLELTGGNYAQLAENEINEGTINEIRLLLGENNSIVVDGDSTELKIPSGSQSGLKIKISQEITNTNLNQIVLDFDVSRSIHSAGNSGKYMLKPVIRAIVDDKFSTGISGTISPNERAKISTIMGIDTINSHTNKSGDFVLNGLIEGSYDLFIKIQGNSELKDTTLAGIEVIDGEITTLGTIIVE